MSARGDEIDDLLWILERVVGSMDDPAEESAPITGLLLIKIVEALKRVPRPKGNPKRIGGRAAVRESLARSVARGRKRNLMEFEKLSATQAELQAAEEAVPMFRKLTGRQLKPSTILKIMQRAPRSRR